MLEYIIIEDSLYFTSEGFGPSEWKYDIGDNIEHDGKKYIIISIDSILISAYKQKLTIGMTVREYGEN